MAKITSNEYTKILWIPESAVTLVDGKPVWTVALLNNAAYDISPAIAWADYALGADNSDDIDDRGITDRGNVTGRGSASYSGTLSFFREKDPAATAATSDYKRVFELFRSPRTNGYLVTRVAIKHWTEAFAVGDYISAFKMIADSNPDVTDGDDYVKYTVNFLAQGYLDVYTKVVAGS